MVPKHADRTELADLGSLPMSKKRRLKIASYNINGINTRLGILTRWLEAFAPDVVGLQELKCTCY